MSFNYDIDFSLSSHSWFIFSLLVHKKCSFPMSLISFLVFIVHRIRILVSQIKNVFDNMIICVFHSFYIFSSICISQWSVADENGKKEIYIELFWSEWKHILKKREKTWLEWIHSCRKLSRFIILWKHEQTFISLKVNLSWKCFIFN